MGVTIKPVPGAGNSLDTDPLPSSGADVVVYGATSAGVCAAVAAADGGARVTLVAAGRHVGGMTSGGLGYTDLGDERAIGGLAARFRAETAARYGATPDRWAGPEPHVAESVFDDWLDRAGVEVVREAPLEAVEMQDARISALLAGGRRIEGGVVVDASYEGDLLAAAGVAFRVGREDRGLHGEVFAGRREVVPGRHAMPAWVSPFRDDPRGLHEGPVLDQVRDVPLADVGTGDGGVMAYQFRLCLSRAPDRIAFTRREGYDPAHWELGRRMFHALRATDDAPRAGAFLGLEPNLPHDKTDANSLGPFSLNVLDGSAWEYPSATGARREELRQLHEDHARDLLWFLSSDPQVPVSVRDEMSQWGLAPDEFPDTGHLPHQLYVREARRMVGEAVLTEHDLRAGAVPSDVVALGSYHLDVREVQRAWRWVHEHPDPVAMVVNEGYLSVRVPVYGVGWRSLLPVRQECVNLVVPVCLSASHVAFSSVRMEPQYQMLGQAAGAGAALAARTGSALHDLDVGALQGLLRDAGGVLAP